MPGAATADGISRSLVSDQASFSLPRWAAAGLVAFGAAGLILAAILLLGVVRLATTAGSLADQQRALVELTDSGRATAVDGRAAAERAQAGVAATADAADQAAGFVTELATALRETASSLRVEVFGSQPFAAAADRVDQAADEADQTSAGLRTAATQARAGAGQLQSVAADLERIAAGMSGIGGGLSEGAANGLDDTSLALIEAALIGLLVWLAIPAGFCLWFGIGLWRSGRHHRRPTRWRTPVR